MFKVARSYAFPCLVGVSSCVSTYSDVFNSTKVAYVTAGLIAGLPFVIAIALRVPALKALIQEKLEFKDQFPIIPFALSCFLVAGLVAGFAHLSEQLGEEGGVIASAHPEIRQFQEQLGIVEKKLAAVEQTTIRVEQATNQVNDKANFLIDAAGKWMTVADVRIGGRAPEHFLWLRVENTSAFIFDNVSYSISDSQQPELKAIHQTDLIMVPGTMDVPMAKLKVAPAEFNVCMIGRRRSDGLWTKEVRRYGNARDEDGARIYRVRETSGIEPITEGAKC